jgi:hypothetical protein
VAAWALSIAAGVLVMLVASPARAYPWMIRHGYTGCAPCHTDPSGGAGALTDYGRAQSDLLLRMRYGVTSETGEADKTAGFLWGTVPLPAEARLGGDFREAFFSNQIEGVPIQQQFITMRADLYGDIKVGRFRAAGAIGYEPKGDLTASLTRSGNDNLVSREHWLGVELDEDGGWLLRGGRIALPFGLRMIEHNLWARSLTRTDIDATQQYGLALSFSRDQLRGEVMGIAGNFQVRPDDYRERGYSAYLELAPLTSLAFGVSSLFTRATRDLVYNVTDYRFANGAFLRYAPTEQLVILSEIDSVYQSLTWNGHRPGFAGFTQVDYEPAQGMHVMVTGEAMNTGTAQEPLSGDLWFSGVWFFLPHMDLRVDAIYSAVGVPGTLGQPGGQPATHSNVTTWLAQFHVFL